MEPDDAAKLYLQRINTKIPYFETMTESDLNFVKMINAGERLQLNNVSFGYLSHRIVFYLMNLHIKARHTFFARAGTSSEDDFYKADASLGPEGRAYAKKMADTLIKHREEERAALIAQGGSDAPLKPLIVWTSTRRRTVETSDYLKNIGYRVRQRSQMSQLNPGVCEKMSERAIRREYPDEVEKHELDPYHHRYPRAEVRTPIYSPLYSTPFPCPLLTSCPPPPLFPVHPPQSPNPSTTTNPPLVLPRPRRPPRTHHPGARARKKRPPHNRPRIRAPRSLRLPHGLRRHVDPQTQIPPQRNHRDHPRILPKRSQAHRDS